MPEEDQSVLAISLPEAGNVLSYVRSRFGGEVPPVGAPAHITLLYPWMPPVLIDEKVRAELASLFAGFPIFDFSLKLGWFGREVLLLVPEDPAPFIRLSRAIISRWPEFPYYGGEYDDIEPHVTLAYGDESSLSELAAEVASQVPVRARTSSIGLSIGQPGHMIVRARFSLSPADSPTGGGDIRPESSARRGSTSRVAEPTHWSGQPRPRGRPGCSAS
jgi:hypothetical protein